jgi:hypothetical protein
VKLSQRSQALVAVKTAGYYARNDGSVVSPNGRVLSLCSTPKGYLYFTYRLNGTTVQIMVHRLIAFQKFGYQMFVRGVQVRHLNNCKTNNRATNIAIGSDSDNKYDKPEQERQKHAIEAAMSSRLFTNEQAEEIRALNADGVPYSELCVMFGCAKSTISYIINGKTYK